MTSKKEEASMVVEVCKMQVQQLLIDQDKIKLSYIKTCLDNAIRAIRKLPEEEDDKNDESSKLID